MAENESAIPYLKVDGTHYDVAWKIGRHFQDSIQLYYVKSHFYNQELVPFLTQTDDGKQIYADYLKTVTCVFPQYIEELQGLADGSGVPFEKVFCMHCRRDIRSYFRQDGQTPPKGTVGCSDVFLNVPETNNIFIGHNEDIDALTKHLAYIVNVTIRAREADGGAVLEEFTAYTFPGHLPGSAFSFTRSGLVLNMNGLTPYVRHLKDRIPRYILNRAMISAKTITEFEQFLNEDKYTPSIGFSINIIQLWHNQERAPAMYNYELAPSKDGSRTLIVSKREIQPAGSQLTNANNVIGYYFHCNRYDHNLWAEEVTANTISSRNRTARAMQLPVPTDMAGIKLILGDDDNDEYPIYRNPRPTDNNGTVATALYNFVNMVVDIYKENPRFSSPCYRLSLPDGEKITAA